jgi:hypothetical protein
MSFLSDDRQIAVYVAVSVIIGLYLSILKGLKEIKKRNDRSFDDYAEISLVVFVKTITSLFWVPIYVLVKVLYAIFSFLSPITKKISRGVRSKLKSPATITNNQTAKAPLEKHITLQETNLQHINLIEKQNWDAIYKIGSPAIQDLIFSINRAREHLNHSYRQYRYMVCIGCVNVLGRIADPKAIDFLIETYKDLNKDYPNQSSLDVDLSIEIIDALGNSRDKQVKMFLNEVLGQRKRDRISIAASKALGKIIHGDKRFRISNDELSGYPKPGETCASCKKRQGDPYVFYFSTTLSEIQYKEHRKITYLRPTRNYLSICGPCIMKERVRLTAIGLFLIVVASIIVLFFRRASVGSAGYLLPGVIVFCGIYAFVFPALIPSKKHKVSIGSKAALRLAKPFLKSRGNDAFWDSDPWAGGNLR